MATFSLPVWISCTEIPKNTGVGSSGGVVGNGTMGATGGLGGGPGPEGGYGKAVDFGGTGSVVTIHNVKARESVLVAGWVFEPESEAVGMRCAAFEGPLVS